MQVKNTRTTLLMGLLTAATMSFVACSEDPKFKDTTTTKTTGSNAAPVIAPKPGEGNTAQASPSENKAESPAVLNFVGLFKRCVPNSASDPNGDYYGHFNEFDGSKLHDFEGLYRDNKCTDPIPNDPRDKDFDRFKLKSVSYSSRPSNVPGVYEVDLPDETYVIMGVVDNYLVHGSSENGLYDGSTKEKRPRKLGTVDKIQGHLKIQGSIRDYLPK